MKTENLIGFCPWFLGARLHILRPHQSLCQGEESGWGLTFKNNLVTQGMGVWADLWGGGGEKERRLNSFVWSMIWSITAMQWNSHKNSGHQAQQSFQVCKHMGLPRMGPYPDPSGRRHRSCVQNPSIPCCMCLSIWLALICSLIMIIINWKSKYRMFLSSMSLSNKLLNLREVVGTIWICSHLVRSVGGLGSLEMQLASEMRAIFWGIGSLNLWGLMLTLDGQYQNEIAVLQVGTK